MNQSPCLHENLATAAIMSKIREAYFITLAETDSWQRYCIIHLSANPSAQFKKPQRSPLRLRFLNCTLESVSCVNNTVIYETIYLPVGAEFGGSVWERFVRF